jgi:tetratricopeptide (TPR) repeat protein
MTKKTGDERSPKILYLMPPPAQRDPVALCEQGLQSFRFQLFEIALDLLNQALEADPALAPAYCWRGMALAALGRGDEALVDFNASIRLKPNEALPLCSRGFLLAWLGRLTESEQQDIYEIFSQLPPHDKEIAQIFADDLVYRPCKSETTNSENINLVENDHGPSDNTSNMTTPSEDGDAKLEQELDRLEKKFGIKAARIAFARRASAGNGALNQGMVVAGLLETATEPCLSETDLEIFRSHAKAHPWKSRSGIAPSAHIEATFGQWLGRGLMREHIVEVQPNLAGAYATEISRDPTKRIKSLGVRPPMEKLPVGAPRAASMRPVAELSEAEKTLRREKKAGAQKRWRMKRQNDTPRL